MSNGIVKITSNAYETVHETFHWLTSVYTSAGQMLALSRYTRLKLFLDYLGRIRPDEFQTRLSGSVSERGELPLDRFSALAPALSGELFEFNAEAHNAMILLAFDKLYLKANRSKTHFSRGGALYHPIQIATQAIAQITYEQDRRISGGEPSAAMTQSEVQRLANALRNKFGFAVFGPDKIGVDTEDLFEAFSVIADINAASSSEDFETAEARFSALQDTSYMSFISAVAGELNIAPSVSMLATYWPTLFSILEVALNPPLPPFRGRSLEGLSWANWYPPTRSIMATMIAKVSPAIPRSGCSPEEIDRFQAHLKAQIDPGFKSNQLMERPGQVDFFDARIRASTKTPIRWDWFDLFVQLSRDNRDALKAAGYKSLTAAFAGGALPDLPKSFPPALVKADGQLAVSRKDDMDFALEWLTINGVWLCLEELSFGTRKPRFLSYDHLVPESMAWRRSIAEKVQDQMRSGLKLDLALA
ncbi:MAG: hypothetical protein AAFR92_04195 [Pseudomonadota bacterium]